MIEYAPHIAIAILNYNGRALLERYLPAVANTTYPNKSIWIIDNGSTDDSLEWLQEHFPETGIIQNLDNFGFARGYNEGLRFIEADYYLLLNSDVEVPEGFIEPMIRSMEADPRIAFAQPKMKWLRKKQLFEYAGAAGGLLDMLGYPFCRGRLFEKLEEDHGQYNDKAFVFWASGACLFTRAETFWKLGGFYEFFFMHQEEIDLCWRAQNAGYKILANGSTEVFHLGGASLSKDNPQKTFLNFRNNLVMITRNMPVLRLLWVLPVRWLLDGVAAASFLYKGQGGSAIAVINAWMAFAGWLFSASKHKFPGKRSFENLDGARKTPVLWMKLTGKSQTNSLE